MLLSPAFWIWLWSSWMAVILPTAMVVRALPFLGATDARPAFLVATLGSFTAIAIGIAVLWHFVAWGSMPLLPNGDLRYLPFWPWPGRPFTPYILGS